MQLEPLHIAFSNDRILRNERVAQTRTRFFRVALNFDS